jgi:uncharacterized protein (TIGR04255 family)
MAKGLTETYPTVQQGFEFRGQFRVEPSGSVEQDHESRPNGFRAISRDEVRIVQLRLNGISSSRLAPYVSWEDLQAEAASLWGRYKTNLPIERITRFGLRYINHVRLPYPVGDLDQFFVGLPDPPGEWPQAVSSFLYQSTLHDSTSGYSARIIHALADDVDEDRIGVIFDIDTYVEGSFGISDDQVWGTFEQLRTLKNRIFFSGITDRALELFS